MGEREKIYKGFRSQTAITLVQSILQLVYFSFMSRLLSAEDFGYFAVLIGITAIFTAITEAGLGSSVIQKKAPSQQFISTAFSLSVLVGMSFMVVLCALSSTLSQLFVGSSILTVAFCIMAIDLLLTNIISIIRALYMRRLDFLKYGLYEILSYFISSSIGIFLAWKGYGLYSVVFSTVTNHMLTCIILSIINHDQLSWGISQTSIKEIASYGGWLTASVVLRSIAEQLDKTVLSRWLSVTQLGIYNRPSGIVSQLSNKVFGIFDVILFPILSSLQDDKKKTRSAYTKAFELTAVLSLIFTSVMIFCSEPIIDIFLGSKWNGLTNLLQLIIANLVFLSISRIQDCFFRSLGYVKFYFVSRFILCTATLSGLYIGCRYGLEAVAFSLIVVRVIEISAKALYLNRKTGVSSRQMSWSLVRVSWFLLALFFSIYALKINDVITNPLIITGIYIAVLFVAIAINPAILGATFNSYVWNKAINIFNTNKIK